jgi:hypothetical protein
MLNDISTVNRTKIIIKRSARIKCRDGKAILAVVEVEESNDGFLYTMSASACLRRSRLASGATRAALPSYTSCFHRQSILAYFS